MIEIVRGHEINRYFENHQTGLFWEFTVEGKNLLKRFGNIGRHGTSFRLHTGSWVESYRQGMENALNMVNEGYMEVDGHRFAYDADNTLEVPDRNLKKALEKVFKGPVTQRKLHYLAALNEWNEYLPETGEKWEPFSDLSILEYAENLVSICADGNNVSDLSPLAGMHYLSSVWFTGNNVTDLSPLSECVYLHTLGLDMNYKLENIHPLKNLRSLRFLSISHTSVSDLSPLVSMPALETVSLYGLEKFIVDNRGSINLIHELIDRGVEVNMKDLRQ